MIQQTLRKLIQDRTAAVLKEKGLDVPIPEFDMGPPPSKIGGHLASNVCLMLAKPAKVSPKKLAEDILAQFPKGDVVEKADIAGPGFLNFWLTPRAFSQELNETLSGNGAISGPPPIPGKILIEFVSANPTGPLHVGHGRGAALGDSLVRIFRHLGVDATAEYYINDAGGQIRNLGFSMEARVHELKGEPFEFPEKGYKGDYVKKLAEEAIQSGQNFKPITSDQLTFSEEDLAGYASQRILKIIQNDLNEFGVHFDNWFSETGLHQNNMVGQLFDVLKKKNLVYEQEGAFWFRATEFGDEKDRVLKKADEAPTYFAADIAYHYDKFKRGFSKLINIWGADHHGYAQRVRGAIRALDHESDDLVIILNQLVSIKGGRLSKRAGNMVSLREVIDEVGKDATRFFFALRSPGAHFEFDLDLAKKQANENPVFYVQYVHARCSSIFSEAKKRNMECALGAWSTQADRIQLADVEENVLLHLMDFEKTVRMCARDYSNHHLTVYLLELAGKYHSFYEKCRVLEENDTVRSFRLDLVRAIQKRVKDGLALLGVSAPERL